jgi:hypothetical protein
MTETEDRRAPAPRPYFGRCYVGATGAADERMRPSRFIRDLIASEYVRWWDVEIIRGSGSPAAEWLQMHREYDLHRAARHVQAMVARASR